MKKSLHLPNQTYETDILEKMADVSWLPLFNDEDAGDPHLNDVVEDLQNLHLWSHNFHNFVIDTSDFPTSHRRTESIFSDDVSDPESVILNPDLFDRENQVNFVMDLFHQQVEQSHSSTDVVPDPDWGHPDAGLETHSVEFEGSDGMGDLSELDLGLGFGNSDSGFVFEDCVGEEQLVGGLRAVNLGSDSDENGVIRVEFEDGHEHESDGIICDDDDMSVQLQLCWDSFHLEEARGDATEEFGWEEVDLRADERASLFVDDSDDDDGSMIHPREDQMGAFGNLEWQVLLNLQNLDMNREEFGNSEFLEDDEQLGDFDGPPYFLEEILLARQAAPSIAPLASKNIFENLPTVVLSLEYVEKSNVVCAVCKDDMSVGDSAKQLPCSHMYHGDCIRPWLEIRSNCPVCRYELAADDPHCEGGRRVPPRISTLN